MSSRCEYEKAGRHLAELSRIMMAYSMPEEAWGELTKAQDAIAKARQQHEDTVEALAAMESYYD